MTRDYIRWFEQIGGDDVPLVGGKAASLGELYQVGVTVGAAVPPGFAVTAQAYRDLIAENGLEATLEELLSSNDPASAAATAERCRELILEGTLPDGVEAQIVSACAELRARSASDVAFAVRSSATAEDLPEASFAGQHDSFLNVRDDAAVIDAYHRCLASVFTRRAIEYRNNHGFAHLDVALSVVIMQMVRSDLAASGVAFTVDTESGHPDVVLVTAAYGLGETIVQGVVDPDEFYVHKPSLERGFRCVLRRRLGSKAVKMIYADATTDAATESVPTDPEARARFAIDDQEVLALGEVATKIEAHYSARAGRRTPMDVEWAKDGRDGKLYIVQARPETVTSRQDEGLLVRYHLTGKGPVLCEGRAVGTRAATAPVRVIRNASELAGFKEGEVLVADNTTPDWGAVMRRAAALVTNRGGRTCHAAIVARELGIPAVVGCGDATETLTDGARVTVACCEGEVGRVYGEGASFERIEEDTTRLARPRTRIMMNVGDPDVAFRVAQIPNDGVGLARMEFIINEYVKVHPMALAHPDRVSDPEAAAAIAALTAGYASPTEFFVERLSEGVGTIAAAFFPRPVIVRLSDFKTHEYARLLGGADFEPPEPNPMLGFRGASRYAHPAYEDGFALECGAMKRVREVMGLDNVKLMIPFCRRVAEAAQVLECMARHGLERGANGLEVYVMCEIPNNVLLIDEFSAYFDGFSIGSNDLTQLTLGVDRDSETVAFDFDERDPGVLKMLAMAVEGAKRNGRHSGICGQAPSDYPEVAEYLVRLGIDSLSLNPDSVLATTRAIVDLEARLADEGKS